MGLRGERAASGALTAYERQTDCCLPPGRAGGMRLSRPLWGLCCLKADLGGGEGTKTGWEGVGK